jgi:hypothetical protein
MKRARESVALPLPGSAFVFTLTDGRFGLCRVLRAVTDDERRTFGNCVLVATSSWIGNVPPPLADASVRAILRKTHHSWNGKDDVYFVLAPPPPEYRLVGEIEPSGEDEAMPCNSIGNWKSEAQVFLQWRWEHDRDALLAEEARDALEKKRAAEAARARDDQRRSELTWAKLRTKVRFAGWSEHLVDDIVVSSRTLFTEAIDALAALGPKEKRNARGVLKMLVQGFNRLDEKHEHFIETIEREEICEEIEDIAFLAGLPDDIADEWRDW